MPVPATLNPGEVFKQYFDIVTASTDALRDDVYRVRHQVYCEDLHFESPRPDGREHDEYDAHSMHILIRSVKLDEFVGCVRIIRARPQVPDYPFPFETACAATLDRTIIDSAKLPRGTICEISRLAVVGKFRNRKGEKKSAVSISDEDFGTPQQPRFPYIPIGLYLGALELARLNGIESVFTLTEPRLASHFRKIGAPIQTIGGPIELHGQRIPSMMKTLDTINGFKTTMGSLYRTIAADIINEH